MTELANEFLSHVVTRAKEVLGEFEGASVTNEDGRVTITTADMIAHVNFYELDPGAPEVVELMSSATDDPDNPTFFLHFEMNDLDHAKELLEDLLDTLVKRQGGASLKILLSCTSGLTTSLFAKKLAEVASTLSLDYEFEAQPIEQALKVADDYAAVMLAPQVHARRDEMVSLHPGLVVFEIPAQVFGSYDAGSALRMLLEALSERTLATRLEQADRRIARNIVQDRRVLVLGWEVDAHRSAVDYRLFDHGDLVKSAHMYRSRPSWDDLVDVRAALRVMGVLEDGIEALGVVVGGSVSDDGVRLEALGEDPYDLKTRLERVWGVPVFMDDAANAAAVGCYAWQEEYDTVLVHRQPLGATVGCQGLVVDGQLVRGAHGNAGDLSRMVRYIWGEDALAERSWTSEQVAGIVASYVLAALACTEPGIVYTSIDLLPDASLLGSELAKVLPEGQVPKIVPVDNFHELSLVGEYVLCLDALRRSKVA